MEISQIVTGERLQSIADIYLGEDSSTFEFNPWISIQKDKHKYLSDFDNNISYNNPRIVFCYGHLIYKFSKIVHLFTNPFILITHNSDENMIPGKPEIDMILNSPNLIRWFSQNVGIFREKMSFIPIGIANRQWPHGNLEIFRDILKMDLIRIKSKMIYMCFDITTNSVERKKCVYSLINKIPFLQMTDFRNHIFRMAEYRFCICPVGNGLDTHRLWECFYLKVVPIMLKNTYSLNIKNTTDLPIVLLDSWDDLCVITDDNKIIYNFPDYATFDFDSCQKYLQMKYYMKEIMSI